MGKSTYISFQDYLSNKGLLHLEGEALALERKKYQKQYARMYMKNRRKTHTKVELLFTSEESKKLDNFVKSYRTNRTEFCKKSIVNIIKQQPIYIHQETLQLLLLEIKKIGNLINQVVRSVHTYKRIYPIDVNALQKHLERLEQQVTHYFKEDTIFSKNAHQNSKS